GAKDLLGLCFLFEDLVARLGVVGCGEDDVDAAVEGGGAEIRTERDSEARLRGGFCGRGLRGGLENCGRRREGNETGEPVESKFASGRTRVERNILRRTRH